MLVVCPSCGRHAFEHETSCPHCGQKGRPTLLALTMALGFVATACSGPTDVYGPPPVDPDARATTSVTTSTAAPNDTVVAVYGPPPVDPNTRLPSAMPSGAPSASAAPTDKPKVVDPPVDVYGPPPRDPNQRK